MFQDALKTFHEAIGEKDIPLHTFEFFLAISEKSPPTIQEIGKLFPYLSQSAISRNVQILTGESKTRQDKGLSLCTAEPDPKDRRYKRIELTPLGKSIRDSIYERGLNLLKD